MHASLDHMVCLQMKPFLASLGPIVLPAMALCALIPHLDVDGREDSPAGDQYVQLLLYKHIHPRSRLAIACWEPPSLW
jgi:hypothetical protein